MTQKTTRKLLLCFIAGIIFTNVSFSKELIVTVNCDNDTTAPTIQPIADQTTDAGSTCQATLADFTSLAVVSDNCDPNPTVTQSPLAGTVISGTTQVTMTVTDASGNSAFETFNVIVEDVTAPIISEVLDHSVAANVNCEAVLTDYTSYVNVEDNCDPNPTLMQSPLPGTVINGTTVVSIIATDASGNFSSINFTVTLNDVLKPVINPIPNQLGDANANCEVILEDYTLIAVVSDNCDPNPILTQSPAPGTIITSTTTVTITATDNAGNSASRSFNVTINDTTPPTIDPLLDQIVDANINCEAVLSSYAHLAVVADNCDPNPTVTQSPAAGSIISGTTTVVMTVTDASGNSSFTTFDVTVEDNMAPTIDTIVDQTTDADANCEAILADYTVLAIVDDNCDPNPLVVQSPAPGTMVSDSTIITITATDISGNSSSTTFTLTVEDNTAPTIDAIADQIVPADANCEATLMDYTTMAVTADNCDPNPIVTQMPSSGTIFFGSTTVTLTVTDADGNFSSTSFDVIIEDTTSPIIDTIADQTVDSDMNCEAILADYTGLAVVTDNCDANPAITQSPAPGTLLTGNTTITITATDASGNSSVTMFDVILEDVIAPTIDTMADQIVFADANCEAILADYTSFAVTADNCDANPIVTQMPAPGTIFTVSTIVTMTVTDAAGNFSSTSFEVTIEDNMAPTIDAITDQVVTGNASCEGTLGDYISLAVVDDNCDTNLMVTQSPAPGTVFSGSMTVTLTVTDTSGNDSSTTFEVAVEDTTAPTIDAIANQTVTSDSSCEAILADYTTMAIVADNCDPSPIVTQNPVAGSTISGTTTVTLTVTDASGNFATTSFDVTAEDVIDPVISTLSNQIISANANCEANLPDYISQVTITDNCDASPIVTQTPAAGTIISGNNNSVTITATDAAGNSTSITFDVSVEDTTAPSIGSIADQNVPSNIACEVILSNYIGMAVVADNCDPAPVVTQSPAPGTIITGTTQVTLTVTDASGNVNSTSFDVIPEDVTPPTINPIANQTVNANTTCQGLLPNYVYLAVVSDNCDATPVITQSPAAGTLFTGAASVTITATDASGNSAFTTFTVSVEDVTAPTISIANQTVNATSSCEGVLSDYTSIALVLDNCDASPTVTQTPAAGMIFSGTTTVTLTATDAAGNSTSTNFDVTVIDTTAPSINPIANQTVIGDNSCQGILADYTSLAIVSDNCDSSPTLTQTPAAGSTFTASTTVTITATDASGNSASTSFNVEAEDVIAPVINLNTIADFTVDSDASCEGVLPNYALMAEAIDNCDTNPVITQYPNPGIVFSGNIAVTLTATDASGNFSSETFNVEIIDVIAPVIDCPEDRLVLPAEDGNYVLTDLTAEAFAYDNCSANPIITQTPAPGTIFAEGTINTIVLTATDDEGNYSECSFVVKVKSTLSIDSPGFKENDIVVYPSPADNYFQILYNGNATLNSLEIFDIRGRSVSAQAINDNWNSTRFDVSTLSSGIYWINISAEEGSITKRLVIK